LLIFTIPGIYAGGKCEVGIAGGVISFIYVEAVYGGFLDIY
jgi:hypothetical protein